MGGCVPREVADTQRHQSPRALSMSLLMASPCWLDVLDFLEVPTGPTYSLTQGFRIIIGSFSDL